MQQDVSQQKTFRACRLRSITRDMDALDRSCSLQVTTPALGRVLSAAPAGRQLQSELQPLQRRQPRKSAPHTSLPHHVLLLLSATIGRVRKSANSASTSDAAGREELRAVRQRRILSTSSDERIKSKTPLRRERRAQKYTTTIRRKVTLFTVTTWFFRLHLSAPLDPCVRRGLKGHTCGRGAKPRTSRARKGSRRRRTICANAH